MKVRLKSVKRLVTLLGTLMLSSVGAFVWAQDAIPFLNSPSVLGGASPNAREVEGLFWWVIGLSIIVLLVVVAFLGATIIRGIRERNLSEEPPQIHGNVALEVTWTVVPLLILAFLLVLTVNSIYRLSGYAAPENALEVNVYGQQYWWEFQYADSGIVTANELVVPVGQAVKLNLRSRDVMHSFWLPQFAGKTDLVPGNNRVQWFTPDQEGLYYGQCAELCGDSHANMRLRIIALAPDEYAQWEQAANMPAEVSSEQLVQQGSQLFISKGCINCHAVQGVNTYNRVGPDLSHIGSRTSIGAGILANNHDNMVRWLRYTNVVKPGVRMPNLGLNQEEAEAISAYLSDLTLPNVDIVSMIGEGVLEDVDFQQAQLLGGNE